jgi:hypothetical protein
MDCDELELLATIFGNFTSTFTSKSITSTADRIRNLFAQKTQTSAEWEEIPEKKQVNHELSERFRNDTQTI